MNVNVKRAIILASEVAPSKAPNPLFTYLYLEGTEDALVVRASGEVDLEIRLPWYGEAFRPGLVPARALAQLVQAAGETLLLRRGGAGLEVASGAFQAQLTAAEPEGYPSFPEGLEPLASMPAATLRKALAQVRYAVSKEDYRAIFRGVQLEFSERGFRTVASDGYRMALFDHPIPQAATRTVVVPGWSVDQVLRALAAAEDDVALSWRPGFLGVETHAPWGVIRMAVRLMEGVFPNYERVIPKDFPLRASLEVEPFREALKRVSVLADKQNHRVDLFLEERRALLSAEGDYGKGQEEVSVVLEGAPMSLAYNIRYLLEALAPLSGQAELLFSGPTSPTVVRSAEEEGGYWAVVVPLRA